MTGTRIHGARVRLDAPVTVVQPDETVTHLVGGVFVDGPDDGNPFLLAFDGGIRRDMLDWIYDRENVPDTLDSMEGLGGQTITISYRRGGKNRIADVTMQKGAKPTARHKKRNRKNTK